jgi:Mlc titration factor MtfA (ptsG expression regulator)
VWSLKAWRRRRALARSPYGVDEWRRAMAQLPLLDGLDADETARLIDIATLFLAEKSLEGARGLVVGRDLALAIALQAALPLLNLGIDWLRGWVSVVVYADEFVVEHDQLDEAGVMHRYREVRSGEAWEHGPLVLSAADVAAGGQADGYNVVVHEIAHKLDLLTGEVDGFPPLHREMEPAAWTAAFSAAFAEIEASAEAGGETPIDPYAAEAPEEFFAVASEYFFELPDLLADAWPAVYQQLCRFYRQDPLARLLRAGLLSPPG